MCRGECGAQQERQPENKAKTEGGGGLAEGAPGADVRGIRGRRGSAAWGRGIIAFFSRRRLRRPRHTPPLPALNAPGPPINEGPRVWCLEGFTLREAGEAPARAPPAAGSASRVGWDDLRPPPRHHFPFPSLGLNGSAAAGSWCRGGAASPPPPPPPSASQRLNLEAAIFAQAGSDRALMRLRRPRPGYHGTRSADSNFSAFCPAPSRAFPRPPGPRRPLSPKFLVLPARPPPPQPRPQAHMRSRASPMWCPESTQREKGPAPRRVLGRTRPWARTRGRRATPLRMWLWFPRAVAAPAQGAARFNSLTPWFQAFLQARPWLRIPRSFPEAVRSLSRLPTCLAGLRAGRFTCCWDSRDSWRAEFKCQLSWTVAKTKAWEMPPAFYWWQGQKDTPIADSSIYCVLVTCRELT